MGRVAPAGVAGRQLSAALADAFGVSRRIRSFAPELEGVALGSLELEKGSVVGLDLGGCDIRGSSFRGSEFVRCGFVTANLAGADLSGARFENCVFRNATFSGANLDRALFDGCDFRDAELSNCSARRTRFVSSSFCFATLSGADFTQALFSSCPLGAADLRGSLFERCLMPNCTTGKVRLAGARKFYLTRTLVAQVLLDASDGDLERLKYVSLVQARPDLCWDAWREMAASVDPSIRHWAEEAFTGHPESGLIEAFRAGISARS